MGWKFSDVFSPDIIMESTINGWIYFHPLLVGGLYLAGLVTIIFCTCRARKELGLRRAVRKSLLWSLCCCGILYAIAAETIWAKWLQSEHRQFHGLNHEDKQQVLNGDIYRFILECKKILRGAHYTIYPGPVSDDLTWRLLADKFEYYLLPSRNKRAAGYAIVLNDNSITLDERAGVLMRSGIPLAPAQLLYRYNPDLYLVKVSP